MGYFPMFRRFPVVRGVRCEGGAEREYRIVKSDECGRTRHGEQSPEHPLVVSCGVEELLAQVFVPQNVG